MFKIIVIGNSAVGKTSLVNRFASNRFDHNYKATIAADFQVKILNLNGNEIRLQIWDLVGQDTNFAGMNKNFCRNASGAILVADINEIGSIEDAANWKVEIENIVAQNDSPIPMVLAVNKFDLVADKESRGLPLEKHQTKEWVDEFAAQHEFIAGYRVSAKDDVNVSAVFSALVRQMLIKEIQLQAQEEAQQNDRVRLDSVAQQKPKKEKGCC